MVALLLVLAVLAVAILLPLSKERKTPADMALIAAASAGTIGVLAFALLNATDGEDAVSVGAVRTVHKKQRPPAAPGAGDWRVASSGATVLEAAGGWSGARLEVRCRPGSRAGDLEMLLRWEDPLRPLPVDGSADEHRPTDKPATDGLGGGSIRVSLQTDQEPNKREHWALAEGGRAGVAPNPGSLAAALRTTRQLKVVALGAGGVLHTAAFATRGAAQALDTIAARCQGE